MTLLDLPLILLSTPGLNPTPAPLILDLMISFSVTGKSYPQV